MRETYVIESNNNTLKINKSIFKITVNDTGYLYNITIRFKDKKSKKNVKECQYAFCLSKDYMELDMDSFLDVCFYSQVKRGLKNKLKIDKILKRDFKEWFVENIRFNKLVSEYLLN